MTFAASLRRHLDCAPQQVGDKVLASTAGNMWLSHDAGENWQTVSENLPPVAVVRFVG